MKYCYYAGCRSRILKKDYKGIVDFALNNGYSAIEPLAVPSSEKELFQSIEEAREFRKLLDDKGIEVPCYSVGINIFNDPVRSLDYLKRQAELAKALGAVYFHHTVYLPCVMSDNTPTYEAVLDKVTPTIVDIIDSCAQMGLDVLYEPQGGVINGENFLKFIDYLIKDLGRSSVGVCFDVGNSVFVDYPSYDILEQTIPYIKHVHLKDFKLTCGKDEVESDHKSKNGSFFDAVLLGDGDMQVKKCINKLFDHGYDGYYSTELTVKNYTDDEAGIRALEFIRSNF